jgi:hypothetical protein
MGSGSTDALKIDRYTLTGLEERSRMRRQRIDVAISMDILKIVEHAGFLYRGLQTQISSSLCFSFI